VENPAEGERRTEKDWEWGVNMRKSITQLMRCDVVVFLPGWKNSKGAKIEHQPAEGLGMFRMEWDLSACTALHDALT